jgi:hypothetical protein
MLTPNIQSSSNISALAGQDGSGILFKEDQKEFKDVSKSFNKL